MIDKGGLTDKEWQELVTIEYVLTWRYSDNEEKDLARQKTLRKKRWARKLNKN